MYMPAYIAFFLLTTYNIVPLLHQNKINWLYACRKQPVITGTFSLSSVPCVNRGREVL